ncbi:MAG: tetratricopeptide repeat protein [Deltaproteobacteria bacterium]|nr:tetratricopeptide repeat protein [Deltaproteobacteria bacterium]
MPEQTGNQRGAEAEKEIEMGLDLARRGRLEDALRSFTRAIALDEKKSEPFRYRGITYAKMGHHDAAISDFDKAVEKNPECAECFFERAQVKMFSGRLDDALEDVSACLRLNGRFAPAYSLRAGIHARKGLLQEALDDINSALSINPERPDYLHNRAVIMTGLERYRDAIRDYLKVIELNPMSGGSYNNLAWLLVTAKDPRYRDCKKAIALAQKALETGKNGAWMDTLAAAYAECGAFKEAAKIEKEAYRKSNPPNRNFQKRLHLYRNGVSYAQWHENARMSGRFA